MSLQNTPAAERIHIAFFGVRNAGKSSVVNAVTGQELSIVSNVKGTTTDPVKKTMELLPIGPVVIIDTPGIDDVGELGEERVRRTKRILNQTDLAVLVVSAVTGLQEADREVIRLFEQKKIPYLVALNKSDLLPADSQKEAAGTAIATAVASSEETAGATETAGKEQDPASFISVSALTGDGIWNLKEALGKLAKTSAGEKPLVRDLVKTGDLVILVVPIDKAAPKGRLILPQQMVIRDLLDAGAAPVVVRDSEYPDILKKLFGISASSQARRTDPEEDHTADPGTYSHKVAGSSHTADPESGHAADQSAFPAADCAEAACRPSLVITDSQVFGKISAQTPENIPLTSFSMLMARYKGNLRQAVRGAKALHELQDGDTVLISEGCTHHRQCGDIGTVKFPKWLADFTGKQLRYAFTSGADFPDDLSPYRLVIHCGGCMLNEREMRSRSQHADDEIMPMTNYGVAIAEIHGILDRCVRPLL